MMDVDVDCLIEEIDAYLDRSAHRLSLIHI